MCMYVHGAVLQHFDVEIAHTVCSCIVTVKFCCIKTRLEICSSRVFVSSVIVVCFFSF